MRPFATRATESRAAKISLRGWCSTATTVHLDRAATADNLRQTSSAVAASRPVVGSSAKRKRFRARSSQAMVTRRRCPPESASRRTSKRASRPKRRASRRAARFVRFVGQSFGSRSLAWKAKCSIAVSAAGSTSSCGAYAESLRSCVGVAAQPPTKTDPRTRPEVLLPAKTSSSEDLPAPEGPRSAVKPCATGCKEQSSSTRNLFSDTVMVMFTPRICRSGVAFSSKTTFETYSAETRNA
mmetsp:Transcript_28442/g.95783  ORF Transcript_28442/g.95783 Transcript_28442/m.95783 type:complete len:240 (-) Transcript_28442:4248-4967(-)